MKSIIKQLVLASSAALGLVTTHNAIADITLVSSDGRWSATIEDSGGGAGQCTQLKDTTQLAAAQNSVAQTLHYVRLAGTLQFNSTTTVRMEDTFKLMRFTHTSAAFSAILQSTTSDGVIAMVRGEMIAGDTGGLRVSLSFADTTPSGSPFLSTIVKPFVYVNLNVDGQMLANTGGWASGHYYQSAPNSGTGNVRWFVGRSPSANASHHDSFMQDALDDGLLELNGVSFLGPTDINTAISFDQGSLGSESVHLCAYAIGNEGIVIPASFGTEPDAGAVGISSADGRWSATVRTGVDPDASGVAGEIVSVFDFDEPISSASFLSSSRYYAAVGTSGTPQGQALVDSFHRVSFHVPDSNAHMFSTVLNSVEYPGLIAIIDGQMISGNTGGLVTSITYFDVTGDTVSVTPLVYADMDTDAILLNTGGLTDTHFHQRAATKWPSNERWFRSDTFSSSMSAEPLPLSLSLALGSTVLPNVVNNGPANLATAFAYPSRLVTPVSDYAIAFAIGNPGIAIPPWFVVPTQSTVCPADLSNDGFIGAQDLAILLGSWGPILIGSPADITGDGVIDAADLAVLLGAWGLCDVPT